MKTDDWEEIREGLTVVVEHILMPIPSGDMIITECPSCGTRYSHIVGEAHTVRPIVDCIIDQMNEYQLKYQVEWARAIIKHHYNEYWANLGERYDFIYKYPEPPEPKSVYKQACEIIDAWSKRQEELQKK